MVALGFVHVADEAGNKAASPVAVEEAAAVAIFKVEVGIDRAVVDQAGDDAFDDRGAEFFDQVGGEGGVAIAAAMQAGLVGIEAVKFDLAEDMVPEQGIAEAEEGVGGVGGGSFVASAELKARLSQAVAEAAEVVACACAFDAHEAGGCCAVFGFVVEVGEAIDRELQLGVGVAAVLALQEDPAVMKFGADDRFGDFEAVVVAELLLLAGEVAHSSGDRGGASVAVTATGQVGDRDVAFEAGAEGGGGDFGSSEDGNLFEVGQLDAIEGLLAVLDFEAICFAEADGAALTGDVEGAHGVV